MRVEAILRVGLIAVVTVAAPIGVGVVNPPPLRAQSRVNDARLSQAFEVASIKPNKSIPSSRGAGFQRDGRFLARNMPLRSLVAIAYGEPRPLPNFQISGGPDWLDSDGFDIEAKAAGNFPETQAEAGFSTTGELMLQSLLAERFKLVVHRETRQLPVYALVMARSDGKIGPQLKLSAGEDCAKGPSTAGADPNGLPRCGVYQYVGGGAANNRHARVRFMTMEELAKNLQNPVGRIVVNQTGLAGNFSFDLEFAPMLPAASPDTAAVNDSGASIFTAMQEQLGLKLESTRAPVDVIVIDHAEPPTPN